MFTQLVEPLEPRRLFSTITMWHSSGRVSLFPPDDGDGYSFLVNVAPPDRTEFLGTARNDVITVIPATAAADDDSVLVNVSGEQWLVSSGKLRLIGNGGNDKIHVALGDAYAHWDIFINAGAGDDAVVGSAAPERIVAEAGNDSIYGMGGRDTIYGDAGDDFLRGGGGSDLLSGGDGFDSLRGDAGNDNLDGGASKDRLNGSAGDDRIYGGGGNDICAGEDGNDALAGGTGADLMFGNDGFDTLEGGNGGSDDSLFGGAGDDDFIGGHYAEWKDLAAEDVGVLPPVAGAGGSQTATAQILHYRMRGSYSVNLFGP